MSGRIPARYWIVLLAFVMNMLSYTDRVCIAVAGPELRKSFSFSQTQMGLVYSIFSLSYFLGQTPWGILADRWGSRGIVSFAVAGWSLFTALTGAAWSYVSLLTIRFVFGGLEAALAPAVASAFHRWIPQHERATAFGILLCGSRFGAALAPPLIGLLIAHFDWRAPFFFFGAIGLLWSGVWFRWYTDSPVEHGSVTPSKTDVSRTSGVRSASAASKSRWSELIRSTQLWCLLGAVFGSTFMWQFYITWFPTYLREHRGFSFSQAAFYASIPFVSGTLATFFGGALTDLVGRRRGTAFARTAIGLLSLISGALLMSIGMLCPQREIAALTMSCAAGALDLYLGAAWSSAADIGGGGVAGLLNASSNSAGFLSPALMGWVLQRSNNWNLVLILSVATTCAAAVLWWFVNPRQKQQFEPAEALVL